MKKRIFEDSSIPNINRQQRGMTVGKNNSGDANVQPNQVRNFLNANNKDGNYEAPSLKINPIGKCDEILADMYLHTTNLRNLLFQARDNAASSPKQKQIINSIIEVQLKKIVVTLVDISKSLDNISND